jgi:uncharacterized membrane protein YqgA involved in biofilm formation
MIGLGTITNIVLIVLGASIGVLLGNRMPEKTSAVVTDALGLTTLVIGGLNLAALADSKFVAAVTAPGTLLTVLGALILGGVAGSLLKIEARLETFGGWLQAKFSKAGGGSQARARFIHGFLDASLIFCIGPMAILGAFRDGMGQGFDQLALKSFMDGFLAIAFAASLGWGVAASAIPVGAWQGFLTVVAFFLGSVLPGSAIAAITATGGVLMLGIGLRITKIKDIAVGDLLPALIFAPVLTVLVDAIL